MNAEQESHIDWPAEFDRTPPHEREPYTHGFRVTRSTAFQNVLDELRGWDGVTDVQLDSGVEHQKRALSQDIEDHMVVGSKQNHQTGGVADE